MVSACAEVYVQQVCLHCRWLQFNMSANYDTLAIASTDNAARVETTCRHCIFVYAHDLGAAVGRYAPLTGLVSSSKWRELVPGKYEYIYFPEEEVVQTVESVNRCVADNCVKNCNWLSHMCRHCILCVSCVHSCQCILFVRPAAHTL